MMDLSTRLSEACGKAFEALGLDPALGQVKRSDRPDLADFQCNGAMAAAKAAKRNPREIAGEVAERLRGVDGVASIEIAGPGFLNIKVSDVLLSDRASDVLSDARAGAAPVSTPERVMIDFGGPNVAKPMHVGHLRSAVIGDTLQRLMRFLGDNVISDTHLGDWGLQMGHLITELQDEQPDLVYFDEAYSGPYPEVSPVTIGDLGRLYPQASTKAKADTARNERSQYATAELQAGRPGYRALLKHFIDVSVAALKHDYAFLNVSFDMWKGESDVAGLIDAVVEDYRSQGLAEVDDGAVIVRVEREGDTKDYPPLMLVNSLGGTGYHTTDLATIKDRVDSITPQLQRMLYVVDYGQALHFEQVFRAAALVGYFDEDRLEHIQFGTVNGPDGKRLRTRDGGTFALAELNTMALDEAHKKLASSERLPEDMGEAERAEVAAAVALAALRFADLQNVRTTNYIFDLEKFTSFEGKTGPYLMYQAVRIKSVLRKAREAGFEPGTIRVETTKERDLVLALDGFSGACHLARDKRMPHFLCEHVYGLSQAFAAFYAAHPIATEADEATRTSRLGLVSAVLKQLETGLDLLGIRVPERM